jgi:16S rRNA (guanine966-N2)-methyltransferase
LGWLRIIAGELRGRRFAVPRAGEVRPTSDRAREALFSILGEAVRGVSVLDAYAGSGALGFEALSRGASRAVFVESEPAALATLRANVVRLGLAERSRVHQGRVLDLVRHRLLTGPFGVVFVDPPYGAGERGPFLGAALGLIGPGGLIVLERDGRAMQESSAGLELFRTSAHGRCRFDFYRRGGGPAPAGSAARSS